MSNSPSLRPGVELHCSLSSSFWRLFTIIANISMLTILVITHLLVATAITIVTTIVLSIFVLVLLLLLLPILI